MSVDGGMRITRAGRAAREAALGLPYAYHRRLIAESRTWSRAAIEARQQARLERALATFGSGIRTRDDYITEPGRYRRWAVPGLLHPITTSGTTGRPMLFWQDRLWARQKERAYIFDIWSDIGYRPFDTRVVFRGRLGARVLEYNAFENAYYLSPAQLSSHNRTDVMAMLRRIGAFFLHAYPSSLRSLLELFSPEELSRLPIRGVMLGSEAVLPGQIEQIEAALQVQVAYWYGHSEYAVLAAFRRASQSYHFYPTYGALELGGDVAGARPILATSYNRLGTQFVRYDTGDLASSGILAPAAGDSFLRVDNIIGRVQDLMIDRDGLRRSLTAFFFGIHDKLWFFVRDIQFVQRKPGTLEVKIVTKDQRKQHLISDLLHDRFSPFDLRIEWVDQVEKSAAGKYRHFVGMSDASRGER